MVECFVEKDDDKKRLDQVLVKMNLVESRQKALSLIMTGNVFIDEKKIYKAGTPVKVGTKLKVKKEKNIWVSRGGIKLFHALKLSKINVINKVCLDIGCSTGGFSDVLLSKNAKKVYGIDVGYGQVDWKIRSNKKFKIFEKTNAKNLSYDFLKKEIEILVCDVSFISLTKVIIPCTKFLVKNAYIILLIKPQFEIGRELVEKNGIIKNPELHRLACKNIKSFFLKTNLFKFKGFARSPILGQKGNTEFFIFLKKK